MMVFFVFFFKQKTAYEMRISDWSSDVCSSDLPRGGEVERADVQVGELVGREQRHPAAAGRDAGEVVGQVLVRGDPRAVADPHAGQRVAVAEVQVVLGAQARQVGVDGGRADVDRRRAVIVLVLEQGRSEEHTSELQSLMRISYAVFCLKKKKKKNEK